MTLPPVRALGKTRKGGKKKKTPMERGRNNVYIYVYTFMCEIKRGGGGRERVEKQIRRKETTREERTREHPEGWGRDSR